MKSVVASLIAGTAVMLGALLIHGVVPGVQLMQNNPEIMIAAFVTLFFANILMFFVGMGGAQAFTRLLKLPEGILMAGVLIMSLVGSFAVRGNPRPRQGLLAADQLRAERPGEERRALVQDRPA